MCPHDPANINYVQKELIYKKLAKREELWLQEEWKNLIRYLCDVIKEAMGDFNYDHPLRRFLETKYTNAKTNFKNLTSLYSILRIKISKKIINVF